MLPSPTSGITNYCDCQRIRCGHFCHVRNKTREHENTRAFGLQEEKEKERALPLWLQYFYMFKQKLTSPTLTTAARNTHTSNTASKQQGSGLLMDIEAPRLALTSTYTLLIIVLHCSRIQFRLLTLRTPSGPLPCRMSADERFISPLFSLIYSVQVAPCRYSAAVPGGLAASCVEYDRLLRRCCSHPSATTLIVPFQQPPCLGQLSFLWHQQANLPFSSFFPSILHTPNTLFTISFFFFLLLLYSVTTLSVPSNDNDSNTHPHHSSNDPIQP